jgi:hypothetical protein
MVDALITSVDMVIRHDERSTEGSFELRMAHNLDHNDPLLQQRVPGVSRAEAAPCGTKELKIFVGRTGTGCVG